MSDPNSQAPSPVVDPIPESEVHRVMEYNQQLMQRQQGLLQQLTETLKNNRPELTLEFGLDDDLKQIARMPGVSEGVLTLIVLSQITRRLGRIEGRLASMAGPEEE